MAKKNQSHEWHAERESLEQELEAALAKYAAVEPRAGLEERVLANLRAEPEEVPERAWWRWIVAGALAAVVVVALAVAWRQRAPGIAKQPPIAAPTARPFGTLSASNSSEIRKSPVRRASPKDEIATVPKLDQFPSPRPLSEQEKTLASYVEQYPERSVLLARARTEALQKDQLEEIRPLPFSDWDADSDDQNNQTTQR